MIFGGEFLKKENDAEHYVKRKTVTIYKNNRHDNIVCLFNVWIG